MFHVPVKRTATVKPVGDLMRCEGCDNQEEVDFVFHPKTRRVECACCGQVETYDNFDWGEES